MEIESEIIERERQFWSGTAPYYEQWTAQEAVFVFPPPVGILSRAEAINGIRSGARWNALRMERITFHQTGDATATLAYKASARRPEDSGEYVALIGSVYVQEAGQWRLVFHQHTPILQVG